MLTPLEQLIPDNSDWQHLCQRLNRASTLSAIVLMAWQMGMWLANSIVSQQLAVRVQRPTEWGECRVCGTRLVSKGFAPRQMLTLVGVVKWTRRVGRCPKQCLGSQSMPFDSVLGIGRYQKTSIELVRLASLLVVFVPFELASQLLQQLTGLEVGAATIWQWVQSVGSQAMIQLDEQLSDFEMGGTVPSEITDAERAVMPLVIAADGVLVPFRPHGGSPKGKRVFQEVKVAVLARLGSHLNRVGTAVTRLYQRRVVALLGNLEALQTRLCLEAARQGINEAPQVVWISDGARGFWRLFEASFAHCAVGILDFYHAAQHLWQAAEAYQDGNPDRTPKIWFERMRHQLRQGYIHRILKELLWLSSPQSSTSDVTKSELLKVYNYLHDHLKHGQYHQFKQQGLPLGSGMVESACKWLITQRFKGTGMRWSEAGFNTLLHLRVAWVNQRFDALFSEQPLTLSLYSPNQ
jgi:hypothetical protein